MAVPIVASFAVQTVTKLLEIFSARRLTERKNKAGRGSTDSSDKYVSHSELVIRHHRTLDQERASSLRLSSPSTSKSQDANAAVDQTADETDGDADVKSAKSHTQSVNQRYVESLPDTTNNISIQGASEDTATDIADEAALKDMDKLLVKRVLQLAVEIETHARILLMHALPKGSPPEVLLRADLRLQNREIRKLSLEDSTTKITPEGLVDLSKLEGGNIDVEDCIMRYRELYAGLLATGTQLQRLEGVEQLVWERRAKTELQAAERNAYVEPMKGRRREKSIVGSSQKSAEHVSWDAV